jgi:hypothetical protein
MTARRTRRALLFMAAPALAALASCQAVKGYLTNMTPAQAVDDIKLMADAAVREKAALDDLATKAGAAPQQIAIVDTAIATLADAAGKVSASLTQTKAQSFASQAFGAVTAMLKALSGVTLPDAITKVLAALQVLAPIVLALVGMAIPVASAQAPVGVAGAAEKMTGPEARIVLHAVTR